MYHNNIWPAGRSKSSHAKYASRNKRNTYVAHGDLSVGVASSRPFAGRRQRRRRLSLFVQLPSLDVEIAGEHDPTAAGHGVSASRRLPPARGKHTNGIISTSDTIRTSKIEFALRKFVLKRSHVPTHAIVFSRHI